jgi:S-formylglutathione hydrolase
MWRDEQIAAKPADVYEPPGLTKPRFGVLFLHPVGLETLRDRQPWTQLLDRWQMPCVCPHTGRSWWTDRICPEFDPQLTAEQHILRNVLPYFEQRWGLRPRSIGLVGISMGGQGALRLAFRHPTLFPVTAGISSALDYHEIYGEGTPLDEMYDSKEQCRQDTAPMHVHPSRYPPHLFFASDPREAFWHRGSDRLHEKLNALGVPHEIDFAPDPGTAERAVRFLCAGLEQEGRRLL